MQPRDTTTGRIRGTTREVEAAARILRSRLTPAEQILWEALRGRRLNGLKFRCQHPVGPFVADFYCPAHMLVVEVDGPIHARQVEQDRYRTEHLEAYGCRVVRFRNEEVLRELESVLERIAQATLDPPPRPPNSEGSAAVQRRRPAR